MAIEDSSGKSLTYHESLVLAFALANLLHDELDSVQSVGVLMPPCAAGALANLALTLLGRTVVNLNYTASKETIDFCLNQCGITFVLTAQKVLERLKFKLGSQAIAMESLQEKATFLTKAWAWSEADLLPECMLGFVLPGLAEHGEGEKLDEVAAIIFTAGTTGEPKGVMLSHRNILSNINAVIAHARIYDRQTVLGVLPFFHSFGFLLTLWGPLVLGHSVVYHTNPFESRILGALCEKHSVSVIFATPTILRACMNRCHAEQFRTVKLCIAGGEKLRNELAVSLKGQLGLFVLEGYGLTETSTVVACNVPFEVSLSDGTRVLGYKSGTVGLPLPGTSLKIVDMQTQGEMPIGKEGMVLVRGPLIMKGYLHNPEATARAMSGDWFITGDLGFVDQSGFLTVSGRLSQFSKIAGEMVPQIGVQEKILAITGGDEQSLAVTALPDSARGERLVVLYTDLGGLNPQELVQALEQTEISRLWIPAAHDFLHVETLPVLPTCKVNVKAIRLIAEKALAAPDSPVG